MNIQNAFLLDIGTTTLELACMCGSEIKMRRRFENPQVLYGRDVISRIKFCTDHGTEKCRSALLSALSREIGRMKTETGVSPDRLIAAGNTAMLHIFFGEDVKGLGMFPYTPVFLSSQERTVPELERAGIGKVITLPCLSAFVGADAVAGLYSCGVTEKFRALIDLGTNAEILLWNRGRLYAASAACGPCFEGGNISCGMTASDGAVSSFRIENGKYIYKTVGGAPARGICGSALFDIAAEMLENGLCTRDGAMQGDLVIDGDVRFTQADMRAFQLGKAAVATALGLLMKRAGVTDGQLEKVFISGGFSDGINVRNASLCGLIPRVLSDRTITSGNSVMPGLVKYAAGEDFGWLVGNAEVTDLSLEDDFQAELMKNINF